MKADFPEIQVIPYDQLGDTKMSDISTGGIEVSNVPGASFCSRLNVQVRNHNQYRCDDHDSKTFYIFADVYFDAPTSERDTLLKRVAFAFPERSEIQPYRDGTPVYKHYVTQFDQHLTIGVDVDLDLSDCPHILVQAAIVPLIVSLKRMSLDPPTVFVCHASEDKPAARVISETLRQNGAIVWLDEWEIRVGDSIVARVNDGLQASANLVLLLSHHSVEKPWVQREFSATLMRQLSDSQVRILPVKLDTCTPPVIIADLKYADGTRSLSDAIKQIQKALSLTST